MTGSVRVDRPETSDDRRPRPPRRPSLRVRVVPRLFVDDLRPGVVVLLVTLVAAALLAAWPRAVQVVSDDIVSARLDATTPATRDVSSSNQQPVLGPAPAGASSTLPAEWETTFGLLASMLQVMRGDLPDPLAAGVLDARFRTYSDPVGVVVEPPSDVRAVKLVLTQDPFLTEHVTLVEGRWPTAADSPGAVTEGPGSVVEQTPGGVALSEAAARRLAWEVGEERPSSGGQMVLLGTYTADDPAEDYWYHSPAGAVPYILDDPDFGITLTAPAYIGPGDQGFLSRLSVWFEIDPRPFTAAALPDVASQLRGFTAVAHPTGSGATRGSLKFSSELPATLDGAVRDVSATTTVMALLASGPVAGLGLLLLSAVRVVATRRSAALALIRARGASGVQVRGLMALEGLVVGLIAGGLGLSVAVLAVPADLAPSVLVGPSVAAVAPAVMLAAAVPAAGLRRTRRDSGLRSASRVRLAWEVLAVGAAVVATVLVLRRGAADTGSGTDPLLAAVPALLAVAAAVVVARVSPVLLAPVVRIARARRGALGLVGAASATRDRRGQLPTLVGLVVAVTVAVLSTVLLVTVRTGMETQAWERVGADLRSTGPIVDDTDLDLVRAVPGVVAATTVAELTPAALSTGDDRLQTRVLLVDPAALAEVQSGLSGWTVPEPTGVGGPLPAVVSSSFDLGGAATATVTVEGTEVEIDVVEQRPALPGGSTTSSWVALDRESVVEAAGTSGASRVLLVRLDGDASAGARATTVAQIAEITGPSAVEMLADEVGRRLEDPTLAGLQASLLLATLVSLVVGATTVLLSEVMAAGRRERLFAVLKLLGMPARGARVITTWEVAAWAVPAVVVGAALGLALPVLVARAVDLRAFTGGTTAPPLVYDPLALVGVVGVLVVVVGVCGLVSAVLARRVSSAATLRSVQE